MQVERWKVSAEGQTPRDSVKRDSPLWLYVTVIVMQKLFKNIHV